MKKTLAALFVVALVPAAFAEGSSVTVQGSAPTADSFQIRQTVVQFDDLSIADKQGAATLLGRIDAAADKVCRMPHQMNSVSLQKRIETCRSRAVASAVVKVGSAELNAAAAAR